MAQSQGSKPNLDRYVVIHVATTCDEHGVFVTKDSAEVIELGWILLDAKSAEEVSLQSHSNLDLLLTHGCSSTAKVSSSNHPILPSPRSAVSLPNCRSQCIILSYKLTDEVISQLDNPYVGTRPWGRYVQGCHQPL